MNGSKSSISYRGKPREMHSQGIQGNILELPVHEESDMIYAFTLKATPRVILTIFLILVAISACITTIPVPRATLGTTATLKSANNPVAPPTTVETLTSTLGSPRTLGERSFTVATRISSNVTKAQVDFVNSHYDYVMTSLLSQEVRDRIQGPQLVLYRSIQGTWTDFHQLDWEHINAHENMFCHHRGARILTIWGSWLMDSNDMVDPGNPDAMNHWINYYAVTAAEQIYQYDYDGLFIDSASHRLGSGAVRGKMPDDYDDERWRQGRASSLEFIKSYLPDKSVIFNGLHCQAGAEKSLAYTDGGMWEVFAFNPSTGAYWGAEKWQDVIELAERNRKEKIIVLVSKKTGLTEDVQARMFIAASYLLVSNENVILSMVDLDYNGPKTILYYPEYDLRLGKAIGSYTVSEQGLFVRQFEEGIVLVNPGESKTLIFVPDGDYKRVVPVGGGVVPPTGVWKGFIAYESVGGEIKIPPMSGMILRNR